MAGGYLIVVRFGFIERFVEGQFGPAIAYHEEVLFIHYSSIIRF